MIPNSKKLFLAKYGSKEHIDELLDDPHWPVRHAAVKNPYATKEHISKALNDSLWSVREAAIRNPKVNEEHISKALNDTRIQETIPS